MTNPQSTPEAVVWVAIDVAKDRHEALIEAPGWKSRKKFRVQNTAEEFRAFAEFLHALALPVRIGFEATGNYHRALAYFLHSEGFHLEHAHHAQPGQRRVHFDARRFPRVAVHQVQRAKFPPAGQSVSGEVHRPHLVRSCGQRQRHTRFGAESLAFLTPHGQPFLLVDPVHAFVVHLPLRLFVLFLPTQHPMQPPITEAWSLCRDLSQPRSQRLIVPHPRPITATPPVHPQQPAGAPLAQMSFRANDPHGLSSSLRAHHFFDSTTFRASMSSACCATIFFNRLFSSSNSRNRLASLTSMPPNLAFQR